MWLVLGTLVAEGGGGGSFVPKFRALAAVVLLVLAASASTGTYTLRRGDTLAKVARKLGVPMDALAKANGIADVNKVRAGQTLVVPKPAKPAPAGGAAPVPVAAVRPAATAATVLARHQVQPGETLSAIAKRYGTTVAELQRLNDLANPNRVREGRALAVPVPAPAGVCPVRGATRFDFADSWGAPRHGGRAHEGNDIFAPRGTEVLANVGGVLRHLRGALTGLGYYLAGDDGTTYFGAHLDALAAKPGRVEAGTVIGVVGSTGNAVGTPPHLHFEVKPGGGPPVNPHAYLRSLC